MTAKPLHVDDHVVVECQQLGQLFESLKKHGYQVIGPTVRDGAIVNDSLNSPEDLPAGWTDEQEPGKYRLAPRRDEAPSSYVSGGRVYFTISALARRKDEALFGYAAGPQSWKNYLHPAVRRLWSAKRDGTSFKVEPENEESPKYALIGVRSCDLHAIAAQDKVFMGGAYVNPVYQSLRDNIFIVAVNCGRAGGTCFCASMNTGPKATFGYDVALTEILKDEQHYFLAEIGTIRGAQILAEIPHRPASRVDRENADHTMAETARQMGRAMDTKGIKELLTRNHDHPRWDNVAARCLTCANCTMVCPTCFCVTVEDVTDLTGERAERWRKWDSCFTMDFSRINGGSVRASAKSRYRQWLTHKLATWIDQFGGSGCVGCGRCITWCPAGIDITEEVRAIRETETTRVPSGLKKKKAI
jgi:formate hydrogenlyase subunit 6/NADH:ubiquinone oxidoreductase subunit I